MTCDQVVEGEPLASPRLDHGRLAVLGGNVFEMHPGEARTRQRAPDSRHRIACRPPAGPPTRSWAALPDSSPALVERILVVEQHRQRQRQRQRLRCCRADRRPHRRSAGRRRSASKVWPAAFITSAHRLEARLRVEERARIVLVEQRQMRQLAACRRHAARSCRTTLPVPFCSSLKRSTRVASASWASPGQGMAKSDFLGSGDRGRDGQQQGSDSSSAWDLSSMGGRHRSRSVTGASRDGVTP